MILQTKEQQALRYSQILKWLPAFLPALVSMSCGRGQAANFQMPPPQVTVAPAITQDVPIYLDEIGKTSADETVTIQPQVQGKLIGRHFVDGAFVKKGDLLYSIDPRPFEADLAKQEAQLAQNQAQLEFAQAELARMEKLKGTQAISQEDYDQKKNAVDVAKAQIESAKAQITTSQLNVEYCQIKSPIDGRTGQHMVDVGNVVWNSGPNGGTNMLVIAKIDPIFADFTVTEDDLATVQRYMKLAKESKEPVRVIVDTPNAVNVVEEALGTGLAAPATQPTNTSREGTLEFLDNAVQDGTGTVKLRASIPNSDNHFWPGQYVSVRLVLTVDKNAVLIPTQAIQISQTGPFVFIAENGKAEQRAVVPGQKQGSLIVIDKGVNPGEQVIVTGQLLLTPGAPVTVVEAPTTQPVTALNPKSETRNPKQIQMCQIQNNKRMAVWDLDHWEFCACFGFRVSDFGFNLAGGHS